MPTVCNFCGSTNRSKARYCTGCAHPLPGFVPTGPSALDAVMTARPSVDGDSSSQRGPVVPVLPAETAAFWLRAACLGVAMICGFTLWCLYVTHKPGAPPLQSQIMALLTPHTSTGTSAPPEESSPPAAYVESAQPTPPPQQQTTQQTQQTQQQRMSPSDALFPSSVATPVPETSAKTPAPPAARAVRPPNRTAAVRSPARSTTAAYDSRRETIREAIDEPSAAATDRALPRTSMAPDSGPPIVAGPGPQFDRAPASRRTFNDPGPPVAIGPGPQYDYSRPPVRAPSLPGNDPGPPIAVGPGPQYDYSPRGSGSR